MAQYKDSIHWKILPICAIKFSPTGPEFGSLTQPSYCVIESGSEWKITPVLRPNDEGGQTTVALIFEGSFIVIMNNYETMLPDLKILATTPPVDFDLSLNALSQQPNGARLWVSVDSNIKAKSWHSNWEIVQNGISPRLKINVKGIFSLDVLNDATNKLFTQSWS